MSFLRWIHDSFRAAVVTVELNREASKYYWVSNEHKKECNKIIQEARKGTGLLLPWDDWHKCMQRAKRPFETRPIVKHIAFIVEFIKELAGISSSKKQFEETIEKKAIPPKELPPPRPKPDPKPRPDKPKKPKEKKPKKPEKPKKEKKPKIKTGGKSNLKFSLLSIGKLGKNLKKLPFFAFNLENIDEKILKEINKNLKTKDAA